MKTNKNTLVGKFFHSFDPEGYVYYQGRVTERVELGFLCQLFNWITGEGNTSRVFSDDEVRKFRFYETSDDMDFCYRYEVKTRREPKTYTSDEN